MDESGQSDRTHRIIEQALSDADFGKNDGGYDNGRPARNIEWFIAALRERGYDICEASAAPPEPPHDCVAAEAEIERLTAMTAPDRLPSPTEWHRYLHQEGILVTDEGEECGSWHHRVFLDAAPDRLPSVERYDAQTVGLIAACHEKDIYSRLDLLVALAASLHEEPEGTTRPVDSE